ncbi:hypothetical protein [Microtetraspora glauca]|uniref:SH3 domain-containing protein n=1 Tax=Microtetraspora glauca TaxID=1996 RepID=A0ABV3G9Z1_MICGL
MTFGRRFLSTAAAGALVVGGLSVTLSAGPANASAANCTNGANGFTSIPYNKSGTVETTKDLGGGRRAELHIAWINGVPHRWARISGATKAGDLVWMDYSTTYGDGWIQCGPFTVQSNGSPNTSAAHKATREPGEQFRACGRRVDGDSMCGPWL